MNTLPQAKNTDLVVQDLGKELLVYDLLTHQAYQLNETSMIVFNACDGKTTFDQLKAQHKYTDEIIFLALDGLKRENLLTDDFVSPIAGVSRREVIRKVGLASIVALPAISMIVAPQALQAASGCVNPGGFPAGANVTGFPVQPDCQTCYDYGKRACCSGNATGVSCGFNFAVNGYACTVKCQ